MTEKTRLDELKEFIRQQNWTWTPGKLLNGGVQICVSDGQNFVPVNYWPKIGKIVPQGPESALKTQIIAWIAGGFLQGNTQLAEQSQLTEAVQIASERHIGMDEAGKGDWFGPLVVAAVYVDQATLVALQRAGVRDSKKLKPENIRSLAEQIESIVPAHKRQVVILAPDEYNIRYQQFNNQNLLLADLYVDAVKPVWQNTGCNAIICDQFSKDTQRLDVAFQKAGLPEPIQQHHAEAASIAVAAASILASAAFAYQLDTLGKEAGLSGSLPRGASGVEVLESTFTLILEHHGERSIGKFVKLNFKPIRQLLDQWITANKEKANKEAVSTVLRDGPPVKLKVRAWEERYHPDGYWMFHFRDGGILLWYSNTTGKLHMSGKPTARSYQLLKNKVKNRYWTKGIDDIEKSISNWIPEFEDVEINSVLGVGWKRIPTLLGARFEFTDGGVLLYYSSTRKLLIQGKPEPITRTALAALPDPYWADLEDLTEMLKKLFPDWQLGEQKEKNIHGRAGIQGESRWHPPENALDWLSFWPDNRPLRRVPENELAPCQKELAFDWAGILLNYENRRHLLAHAPTGLGKTLAALVPALAWVAQAPDQRQVFYLVNRVIQHSNPLRELRAGLAKKFEEKTGQQLRVVDIVGRDLLCLSPNARKLTVQCKESREKASFDMLPEGIPSWEDVRSHLQDHSCAYHTLQGLMRKAHLVICDYWWIFSQIAQEVGILGRMGVIFSNCAVIVDEAHNLPLQVRSEFDVDISVEQLHAELASTSPFIRNSFSKIIKMIQQVDSQHGLTPSQLVAQVGGVESIKKALREQVTGEQEYPRLSTVERILRILLQPDDAAVIYPVEEQKGKINLIFRLVDPTPVLEAGYSRVYASLSMSGTLSAPSDSETEMRYQIPLFGLPLSTTEARRYFSPFHLRNQRWIYCDDTYGSYNSRERYLSQYANHIQSISKVTPGVTAVFFSSYAFLEKVYEEISDPLERELIVLEKRADSQAIDSAPPDFAEYEQKLRNLVKHKKRAYLFAVYQGKLAEGADFSNNLIRSVVCVSIPMENPDLFMIRLQERYQDRLRDVAHQLGDNLSQKVREYAVDRYSLSKVLQACGRGIRSEQDRCSFILLDKRYHEMNWRRFLLPRPYHVNRPGDNVRSFYTTTSQQLSFDWDPALLKAIKP